MRSDFPLLYPIAIVIVIWFDDNIIVYHYYPNELFTTLFLIVWCSCMAINESVQYNAGLLPDIILLTQCYFYRGTRLYTMIRFWICSP